MLIQLKNKYGVFELGGGNHPKARIIETEGFGLPSKELQSVTFEGQPGRVVNSCRDMERTILISFDFFGDANEVERFFKIIYHPVEIVCFTAEGRRRTTGRCVNAFDVGNIIYNRFRSAALQFVCDDPYFHDYKPLRLPISQKFDKLPNKWEGGAWYIELPAVATVRTNNAVITNKGNTSVYPVVYIKTLKTAADSPESYGITLSNNTTGKTVTLEYNMSPGEEITFDFPHRNITSSQSGNITNKISDDTVLSDFFLDVGRNSIAVSSLNLNDDIRAEIEYTNNYITAVM